VFIRRGDDFLRFHRAVDQYWHVVAGVVEEGETFGGAAVRELSEETGLNAAVVDPTMPQGYRVPAEMRHEYAPGVDEMAVENFAVEVPAGWEPHPQRGARRVPLVESRGRDRDRALARDKRGPRRDRDA